MKYCRDCRRLWPTEALFCGSCRRSFGGRRCNAGHLSPATASCCTTCGSRKLSLAARHTDLALPVRAVACVVGLLLLKFIFANLWAILAIVVRSMWALASFVVGDSVREALATIFPTIVVATLIWIAFRKILGRHSGAGKGIERLTWLLLVALTRAAARLARQLVVWITTRSSGPPRGGRP